MPEMGFVGPTYTAASIYQDDQECINWYPEVDPAKAEGERGVVALYPTPGLVLRVQLPNAQPVRGMHALPGNTTLLVVAGNSLYSVNRSYAVSFIGFLGSASGPVSITDNGVSAYLVDGANRYYYTWGTGTFSALADGGFTGGNVCDVIDNFVIYNNPNSNQWGATSVASVVSPALSVGTFLSAPGNLVGLICDHRQVYLLGEYCTEVATDTGTFPFPFQTLAGSTMQHGCAAGGSISRLGESFAFLSRDTRGQGVVVQMVGYQPKRISTFAMEAAIAKYGVITDAVAYTYQQSGHEFYVLNFPSADATWVFDMATEMWHRRAWRDTNNVLHRHRGNCAAAFGGEIIVGDWENGNLYAFSQNTYTDNGITIPCIRRARHLTNDLDRVFHQKLQLQFQPGVGLSGTAGTVGVDPQAMLRWSNDGGSTWSNEHWKSIGKQGAYKNRCIWRQLGESRDRIYEVTVTDPVQRVLISSELDAHPGTS